MSVPEITLATSSIICPSHDDIQCNDDNSSSYNLFLGRVPTYVSLASCSLSCIGAVAIIMTYVAFKDLRSGSRSIITYLSIADLLTSLGYLAGGVNYLFHYTFKDETSCERFETICTIQSYITVWSQLSSYTWNCMLALYLFLTISFAKNRLANKLIPTCHIIAWGVPILIAFPLLLYGYLGYSPYSASNWCFIKDTNYQHKKNWLDTQVIIPILIARVIPECLTYVVIIILYTVIKFFILRMKRKLKGDSRSGILEVSLQRVDTKLLMIPLFFILLRVWGLVQFFLILVASKQFHYGCVSQPVHITHMVLGIMEAIGEGGQGWANALLFIVFNAKTRQLIFHHLCYKTCHRKNNLSLLEKLAAQDSQATLSDDSTIDATNSTGLHEVGAESFRNTGQSIQID